VSGAGLIGRRFFAPEVIQTSALDCGPAVLKCLLGGFGVPVNYGRLREACRTDVDGTSVDDLEKIAGQLRLDARQILVPLDHLTIDDAKALPAIVVVKQEEGLPHFVVAWRRLGRRIQIMDPGSGRRWPTAERFVEEVYVHEAEFAAADWRRWAASDAFLRVLRRRMRLAGAPAVCAEAWIASALEDPGWRSLAALDAATRFVSALSSEGGLDRRSAVALLGSLFERARNSGDDAAPSVPETYWTARPVDPATNVDGRLLVRGAVLVQVRAASRPAAGDSEAKRGDARSATPDLARTILGEPERGPVRQLFRVLEADGLLTPAFLAVSLGVAALGTVLDAFLFRGLLDVGPYLKLPEQRLGLLIALISFLAVLAVLEVTTTSSLLRMGRRLEAHLRLRLLRKIPRMGDRFLKSRLTSDMAERSHSLVELRDAPMLGGQLIGSFFQLALTTFGVIWLAPSCAPQALLLALLATLLPFSTQPLLQERDLLLRNKYAALGRFHLDGLLGVLALRAHGAERTFRRGHGRTLLGWARASLGLHRLSVGLDGVQSLATYGVAIWLVSSQVARVEDLGGVLLLVYWVLQLPGLGEDVAELAQEVPSVRNVTARLLEPLGAPEEVPAEQAPASADGRPARMEAGERTQGVSIRLEGASVHLAGRAVLTDVDLAIEPGEHVAIVGPSGAGKTSLVSVLLGWHPVASGRVLVDERALDAGGVVELRRRTAWLDPTVQLWNRSLLDNLTYGSTLEEARGNLGAVLDSAELRSVLARLPEGFRTALGEEGGLISGGEGQRVRLARAMLRGDARLVILDEPFRGLDRATRAELLTRARAWWSGATLLCATHDVHEVRGFDRVVVLAEGRIQEVGPPEELERDPRSRFRQMLDADEAVRTRLWRGPCWRRVRLEGGALVEGGSPW